MNNQIHYSFPRTGNCDDQNGTVLIMVIPVFALFVSIFFVTNKKMHALTFLIEVKFLTTILELGIVNYLYYATK